MCLRIFKLINTCGQRVLQFVDSCASTVDLYADDLDSIDEDGIMFDVLVPDSAELDGKLVDGVFVQGTL